MNKKTLFLALLLITIPLMTSAQAGANPTLQTIVDGLKTSLVALGASLATIAFIVSGFMFLTAAGDPGRLGTAKMSLIAAVIGIAIIALASFAQGFIKSLFGL